MTTHILGNLCLVVQVYQHFFAKSLIQLSGITEDLRSEAAPGGTQPVLLSLIMINS